MAEEELTRFEKAGLRAFKDSRKRGEYDKQFYELLWATEIPQMLELDEQIRRAITKFITEAWDRHLEIGRTQNIDEDSNAQSAMTIALLKGYELGRKLRRPLTAKRVRLRKS